MKIAIRVLAALACLAPAARAADITIDCDAGQSLRAAVLPLSLGEGGEGHRRHARPDRD